MVAVMNASRNGLAVILAGVLTLSACDEKEVILTGPREDVRVVDETAPATSATVTNAKRAIRLPAQVSNAEWPQSIGTQTYRVSHPALRANPQRIWSASIGSGDSRRQRITAAPVVGGGLIYTLDSSARVSAVTTAGAVAWSQDLIPSTDKEGQATGGGMAYSKGVVYVSLGFGRLAALDAKTGSVRWIQQLDSTGSGTPTVHGGLIYLVAGDDTGWAVKTDTGRIAWQFQATPSVANVLGAPAPVLAGKLAVFAFGSGDLVATFKNGGLRRWNATVAGQRVGRSAARIGDVTGGPVVVGNRIYAGNHSGRIVALSAESGERIWTAQEGALSPVWPAGDSIFSVTDLNKLVRIDTRNGSVIWSVDLPKYVKDKPKKRGAIFAHYGPILAGGRIVVASNDGLLRLFSPEDGSLTGTAEVPGGATSSPVVAGNTLYVLGSKGELHAFR